VRQRGSILGRRILGRSILGEIIVPACSPKARVCDLTATGYHVRNRRTAVRADQLSGQGMFSGMTMIRLLCLTSLLLAACAVEDSHIAHEGESRLIGMAEVDLQSCLGAPDEHSTFGSTDVLTYYAPSTSTDTWSVPLVGGFAFTNGGYCHATFQIKDGRVTQILYSGEKNATLAPDAYCAPIMRTCLAHLPQAQPAVDH
jgi:hypothetical protein